MYAVDRTVGDSPAWLFLLLEHQSKPNRWMPFRLLKYCCRIWDRDRRTHRRERELRPIVPMVFYQGRRRWRHATEFSELFAPSVRASPWVPRFGATQDRGTSRSFGEELQRAGVPWPVIESATGIDRDALCALKQRLARSDDETEDAD